nr:integrase, catalytic region, zinc finger, CCHC-type, peptidase aspartic, catalytic [Tanacetum cinerariifolium]
MGTRGSNLYTISLQESSSPTPICFMAKASPTQAWLWHRRLSHLNFNIVNFLSNNDILNDLPKLKYVKEHFVHLVKWVKRSEATSRQKLLKVLKEGYICFIWIYVVPRALKALMVKKYLLMIVDDYSQYMWTHFLILKDETSEKLFLQQTLQIHHYKSWNYYSVLCMMNIFNRGNQVVSKSSTICNLQQQDASPQSNVQPILVPSTPTPKVNAENKDNNQAVNVQFDEDEFINTFYTLVNEVGKSSSHNVDPSNMHTFYRRHRFDYHWMKDHPLKQVRGNLSTPVKTRRHHGNPSKPVQTRRQLATNPEMCMFALTVSKVEPKNIKEVMVDHAWIKVMQDELHQFNRLGVWEHIDKPFRETVIGLK